MRRAAAAHIRRERLTKQIVVVVTHQRQLLLIGAGERVRIDEFDGATRVIQRRLQPDNTTGDEREPHLG
jgi:hypothetical protein